MRIHIYRRKGESPYWHAEVYEGTKRYRFSCLTEDKTTAREYARQRLEELKARYNRGLVGLPDPIRVSEVLKRYEVEGIPKLRPASQRRTLGIVAQVRAWFVGGPVHDPLVASVRPDDVAAFLENKRAEGVCPRTVNLYRATLHRIFRLCVRPWLLIPLRGESGRAERTSRGADRIRKAQGAGRGSETVVAPVRFGVTPLHVGYSGLGRSPQRSDPRTLHRRSLTLSPTPVPSRRAHEIALLLGRSCNPILRTLA
jgi:hypothetical protein